MTYLLDKKSKTKRIKTIFSLLIIFAVFFYFRLPIFNFLSNISQFIFVPIVQTKNFLGEKIYGFSSFFHFKKSLVAENDNLKNIIFNYETKMQNYSVIENENKELKEILGRKTEKMNLVLASVLAKPKQSIHDTLLIDFGEKDGASNGALVFVNGDIPIGRIIEVGSKMSKVILFSKSGEKNEVIIPVARSSKTLELEGEQTEVVSNVHFSLIGRGGSNFEIEAPRDLKFEVGQTAVLPGLHPFVVAKVESVISDARDIVQKVLLVSPVNIQEVRFVQVASGF